ncbi:MAG: CatB-related O-acetyltransferase [Parachlamydiales bacterium]|nr:CatB-related O-acetyltransferase [Parachlamydiales bacterium]
MNGPDPNKTYPFEDLPYDPKTIKRTAFLKNLITRSNIIVGDYSYYDDPSGCEDFENKNVLYHYDFSKEKLIIKKFVAIASDVKFLMSANHKIDGFSTFPFMIFAHGWEKDMDMSVFPYKGDTVIKDDVWIGYGATIMPGVTIGQGAIIASKAVVTKDVDPYTIVGGNPAKLIRKRFDDKTIEDLLKIRWWDWPIDKITKNIKNIIGADLTKLKEAK